MLSKSLAALTGLALPLLAHGIAHGAAHCIAMADAATGQWLLREGQCDVRMPPMSTFKLPLALMGYDSGILQGEHAPLLPFKEGYVDWLPEWRQATDPAVWMKNSVVWYSQQLTGSLGERRFQAYMKRFDYGNGDVSGDAGKQNGLSASWLGSSLRISPDEQVAFLRRAVNGQLGLRPEALAMTAALATVPERVDGWQVVGKTGSGSPVLADGTPDRAQRLGWYVGWLVKGERRIVFAEMDVGPRDEAGPPHGRQVRDDFLRRLPARLGDDTAKVRAAVDAAIVPMMVANKLPGMAVAVTVGGKPYFFNYGLAALAGKVPVTEHTLFELGSISKMFSSTLTTYAQAQGKLSLMDHPSRYVPELAGRPIDRATLLELGTYTAGAMPMQFPDAVMRGGELRYLRDWHSDAPPGRERNYSNPSIGLLGHVTARALGRDFTDAMEQVLFPAFGLRSTYVAVPPAAMPNYAWGYHEGRPVRVNPGPYALEAYGVKSTSADVLRFVQANIDPSGLAPLMRRAVQDTQLPRFKVGPMVQGLGWEQYPWPVTVAQMLAGLETNWGAHAATPVPAVPPTGATLFHKTGSTNGFGAYAVFVPARRIGIVMLANSYHPNTERIKAAHAILSALAP
ncbi:class C beta-lactamase [Pseudoduganella buxea]|uniref:Beta-lactamase n=1 Tax=Pseudoduganella buxea TaxID=1949069 RepID=A0A6I3SZW4_9BURK|nr:class C beta-lactamase [Pseudoduganella buxea]MTV54828.1 class D beta-lactamase [Pseudoduganella buxea]GGC01494.1 hypothetical protein GCM10011572_24270 [Pseudoduganella buxea]